MHKIGQSGGFLNRTGLPLIGNVIKPLAKSVLIPFGLTAAASTLVAGIHKNMFGYGMRPHMLASHLSDLAKQTILIFSNEEMNDIIKIIKSLEEYGLLIKDVSETIKNEAKEQKGGFLGMLLCTLGASLLGNLLTGKGTITTGKGTIEVEGTVKGTIRAGEDTIRAGQNF